MSYPLSKFAYSFQRRFRELATPVETYHLQLADIDSTFKFKPLTLVKSSVRKLSVYVKYAEDDGITVSCNFQKYSALDTIFEPVGVYFDNIPDSTVLSSANLQGRFELTKLCRLRFTNCRIDLAFLEIIKKWNLTVLYKNIMWAYITDVEFRECTFAENVTVGTLVSTFPSVGHIFVADGIYEGLFLYDLPELLTNVYKHGISVGINGNVGKLLEMVKFDDAVSFDKMNNISKGIHIKNRNQKLFKLSLNEIPDHTLDAFRPLIQMWQHRYFGKFVTFDKHECDCSNCDNLNSSDLNYRYIILFTNQPELDLQKRLNRNSRIFLNMTSVLAFALALFFYVILR